MGDAKNFELSHGDSSLCYLAEKTKIRTSKRDDRGQNGKAHGGILLSVCVVPKREGGRAAALFIYSLPAPYNTLYGRAAHTQNCSRFSVIRCRICAACSCAGTAPKLTLRTTVPPWVSRPPHIAQGRWGKFRAMPCALSQAEGFTTLVPVVEVPLRHGDTQISGDQTEEKA